MSDLSQLSCERFDWLQASGLTIAAGSAELSGSAASVCCWQKLLAESQVRGNDQLISPATPILGLNSGRCLLRIVLPNGVMPCDQRCVCPEPESGLVTGHRNARLLQPGPPAHPAAARRPNANGLEVLWNPVNRRVKTREGEAGMTKLCEFGRIGMFSVLLAS